MHVAEVDPFNSGLSQLQKTGAGSTVSVITLDSVNSEPPVVIKIDAEGMELDVLRGAVRLMKQARPFIIFENYLDDDVVKTRAPLEFLREHGYKLFVPVLRFRACMGELSTCRTAITATRCSRPIPIRR